MISKSKIKFIKSLYLKKGREREGLFIAEGPKVVGDLLQAGYRARLMVESDEDVAKVSLLQHPQGVLGVFEMPPSPAVDADRLRQSLRKELMLALDGIQDPGNLGTIIRIADWFGIRTLICSHQTADVYNPKVVQATMGSLARVQVVYTDLVALLREINALAADVADNGEAIPIYGTLLDGTDIYGQQLAAHGLIVMGNEGNGISPAVRQLVTHKLLIPNFNTQATAADSLNVAIATAIVCSEVRRGERIKR